AKDFGAGGLPAWWGFSSYRWTPTSRTTHYTSSDGAVNDSTNILESYEEVTCVPDKDVTVEGWVGGAGGEGSYPPKYITHYYADNVRYTWKLGIDGAAS